MITNETIIKAANAAGVVLSDFRDRWFNPLGDDTDNAMIRRGADISVAYLLDSVSASFYLDEHGMHSEPKSTKKGKAQAEREAVILCAAAKYDAMQGAMK